MKGVAFHVLKFDAPLLNVPALPLGLQKLRFFFSREEEFQFLIRRSTSRLFPEVITTK